MAGKVVCKCGIKRESGWLYYVDKKGNASRVNMKRAGKPYKKKVQVLHKCGIKRQSGFLYYVDKKGNVSCAKMARGGRKKKKK
jgi:phage pi2 protein 07